MNCIAGVFPPMKGQIKINDVDVTKMSEFVRAPLHRQSLQDPMKGTAGDMQVEENLAMASRRVSLFLFDGVQTPAEKKLLLSFLENWILGLENRLTTRIAVFYPAAKDKLYITLLMATLVKPQILLLDEHTAALDPKTAEKVFNAD